MISAKKLLLSSGGKESYWINVFYGNWTAAGSALRFDGIDEDSSGNVYAAGLAGANSTGANQYKSLFSKIDRLGNVVSQNSIGETWPYGTYRWYGGGAAVPNDGSNNIIYSLYPSSTTGGIAIHSVDLNFSSIKNTKILKGVDSTVVGKVKSPGDGFAYAGFGTSNAVSDDKLVFSFVTKFNSTGNPVWIRGGGGWQANGYDVVYGDFCVDSDSNVYLVGKGGWNAANTLAIMKVDKNGNTLWRKEVYTTNTIFQYEVRSVCCTKDAIYINSGGTLQAGTINGVCYLTKVGADGTYLWTCRYLQNGTAMSALGLGIIECNKDGSLLYSFSNSYKTILKIDPLDGSPLASYTNDINVRHVTVKDKSLLIAGTIEYSTGFYPAYGFVIKAPLDLSRGGSFTVNGAAFNFCIPNSDTWTKANVGTLKATAVPDPISSGQVDDTIATNPAIQSPTVLTVANTSI